MIGVVIMPTDAMPDELSFVRGAVGELSGALRSEFCLVRGRCEILFWVGSSVG